MTAPEPCAHKPHATNHAPRLQPMDTYTTKCRLYTWGANSYGQLGQGNTEDLADPQHTESSLLKGVICITGGGGHSALITDSGSLLVCGQNHKGQLGLGHTTEVLTFVPLSLSSPVQQVCCGWDSTLFLTDSGQVLSCGSNAFGQLGVSLQVPYSAEPLPVQSLHEPVISIAAGLRHALAVTCSGGVYQWGKGMHSQAKRCRHDTVLPSYLSSKEPCKVPGLDLVTSVKVAAGSTHSACLTGGDVFLWGSNKYGQLGHADSFLPLPVALDHSLFNGESVIHIHSGWTHLIASTESGRVFTWGRACYGQLGRPVPANEGTDLGRDAAQTGSSLRPHSVPTEISHLAGASQIACGSEHNLAIKGDCLFSWGWNEHGMCGDGSLCDVMRPQPIPALRAARPVLIGCGAGHSMALCCLKDREVEDCATASAAQAEEKRHKILPEQLNKSTQTTNGTTPWLDTNTFGCSRNTHRRLVGK
ncbi:secretion-regulating guanine nucleotide exchange factor isoform X2 [Alosa alosa]|uniref:secretion-regulating guanine nucleotide exchange factor isoform X2 n=1 Tax=Alosa alosa TaxID=278164 RepID=UPI0020150DA0|nr:secretion-regulating guanine nucleotide exchange factor isoform X2 [Alosa alosa]